MRGGWEAGKEADSEGKQWFGAHCPGRGAGPVESALSPGSTRPTWVSVGSRCVPCGSLGRSARGMHRERQGPGTERGDVPAVGRRRSRPGVRARQWGSSTPSLMSPQPTLNLILTGKCRCTDSENLKGCTCAVIGGRAGGGGDLGNAQLQAVTG